MKKLTQILATTLFVVGAPMAFAQSSIGVGASNLGDSDIDVTGLALDFSGRFSDNFGYALSSHFGGSDDYFGADIKVNHLIAAKLRAGLAVESTFLYLTGGYGRIEGEASAFGASITESGNGAVYGVGFETFFAGSNWGVVLEYNTGGCDLDDIDQVLATVKYQF